MDATPMRPVPVELLSLRSATTTYLAMLRDVDQWAEQAADVNRVIRPDFADQLDDLRYRIREATKGAADGSVRSIAGAIDRLCEA